MKTTKQILLIIFIVSLYNSLTFSQWVLQTSGTTTVLLDIDYVTPQNGGLAVACGSNGNVYRSSNGGANWTEISTGISSQLSDIEFTDINTGYSAGSSGKIIKTTNGGLNWSVQSTDSTNSFTCIWFVNSATGFISGTNTSSAVILKTTNSGVNWNPCAVVTQSNSLQSVFFIDASSGWSVGYNGTTFLGSILRTTNSGASWQDMFVSSQPNLFIDIFMNNSNEGFTSSSVNISKTTNGGSSLSPSFVPANTQLDLEFVNATTGYSCGAPGLIYKTTNGGVNWSQQAAPGGGVPLRTVSMIGDTGFVCGSNGTILKTTNGGQMPTGLISNGNEIPSGYSLSQNYPNPFNPETKINFSVPLLRGVSEGRSVFIKLAIYDMLGRQAALPVNESLAPGKYSIDFNASSLLSGTYFYRITAGTFNETKKMVLIK